MEKKTRKPLAKISATSYGTYLRCPYQWYLKYELKLLQEENPNFLIGTAYHRALELYHKENLQEDELLKEIRPLVIESGGIEEIQRFGLVRTMVKKYLENPMAGDVVDTEWEFLVELPNSEVKLHGFIDRIGNEDAVEIKTSAKDFTEEDINTPQTSIYSYAFLVTFSKIPMITFNVMNKKKAKKPNYKPQELKIKLTEEEILNDMEKIKETVSKIDNGEFHHTPGQQCYFCPYGKKGTGNCPHSI